MIIDDGEQQWTKLGLRYEQILSSQYVNWEAERHRDRDIETGDVLEFYVIQIYCILYMVYMDMAYVAVVIYVVYISICTESSLSSVSI